MPLDFDAIKAAGAAAAAEEGQRQLQMILDADEDADEQALADALAADALADQAALDALNADIVGLQEEVEELEDQIEALEDAAGDFPAQLAAKDAIIAERDETIVELNASIVSKDEEISVLMADMADLEGAYDELSSQNAALSADNEQLEDEVEAVQGQLATANTQINTLQGQIVTLNSQKAALQAQVNQLQADLAECEASHVPSDPPLPSISVSDAPTRAEAAGPLVFNVSLAGAYTAGHLMVDYIVVGGTASAGTDFVADSGTLTFNPGEVTKQVNVVLLNDSLVESTETVSVQLSNYRAAPKLGVIGDNVGWGSITSEDVDPPPPPPSSEPNANTTGVRAGVTLTAYTGPSVISTNGTVITGKTINAGISVTGSNVVFRDCRIQGNSTWMIEADAAQNLTIEYCDFVATGSGTAVKGILARGKIKYNDFRGMCIAITTKGGPGTEIVGNYIHDLLGPSGTHFDGIFIAGDEYEILVEGNSITIPANGGTASIFIATRWSGADITRPRVIGNWLRGQPSYQIYVEDTAVANIIGPTLLQNNKIQRGAFGYWTLTNPSQVTRTGNTDIGTGANIDNS